MHAFEFETLSVHRMPLFFSFFKEMPLPAALLARLKKRGLVKEDKDTESEIFWNAFPFPVGLRVLRSLCSKIWLRPTCIAKAKKTAVLEKTLEIDTKSAFIFVLYAFSDSKRPILKGVPTCRLISLDFNWPMLYFYEQWSGNEKLLSSLSINKIILMVYVSLQIWFEEILNVCSSLETKKR